MDLDRGTRERAHGPSRGGRGGGDRGSRREVGGAAARGRRFAERPDGDGRRAPRVPRPELREMVAAGPLRVRGGDPEDRGRQVSQDRASRAVRRPTSGDHVEHGVRPHGSDPYRRREGAMGQFISTEHDGAVAVVTIDHPPVNALSAALLEELEAELERLDADDAVRAIVLKGAGERAFVAGADISEFPSLREAAKDEGGSARGIQKLGARMDAARTPFVAAIHGFCLGGVLELAMCCDIRVAAEDAQLGQPEIKLGLIPGGGGTQRLPRLVGLGRALLLNLGGDFVDAATAERWGLVDKLVPAGELIEAAVDVARTFAERSPYAVAVLRELARTTRDLSLEEGLRREAEGFRRCLESEDGAEGVAAFLGKREPTFTGR